MVGFQMLELAAQRTDDYAKRCAIRWENGRMGVSVDSEFGVRGKRPDFWIRTGSNIVDDNEEIECVVSDGDEQAYPVDSVRVGICCDDD